MPVNPPIGQALPGNPTKCDSRALHIVEAKGCAGVVAEIKLGHIALKVLRPNMVEGADQPALEDREVAFHGVGGNAVA